MATIALPSKDRKLERYTTGEPIVFPSQAETQRFNRIAYAAAHVVADPLADIDPWDEAAIDWEKTISFRHYLWDLGLGVAEAMDTSQRGNGLVWADAKKLIGHALDAAKTRPGVKICCGVGTDHLDPASEPDIDCHHWEFRRTDRSNRGDGRKACHHGKPRARPRRENAGRL